jgi:hypothetical protein
MMLAMVGLRHGRLLVATALIRYRDEDFGTDS